MLTTVAVSVAVYLLYCPVCGIACTIVAQGHLQCDCCAEQLLVQPCKVIRIAPLAILQVCLR